MDLVVEPDRHASNPLLAHARHVLQPTLEILLLDLSKLSLSQALSTRPQQIVRPPDDRERASTQALESRVERRMSAAWVQDPAVGRNRVGNLERLGIGGRGARRGTRRVGGRGEGRRGGGEGRGSGLVAWSADGGKVKRARTEERIPGLDLKRSGSARRDDLLVGITGEDGLVEGGGVGHGRVQSADVCGSG